MSAKREARAKAMTAARIAGQAYRDIAAEFGVTKDFARKEIQRELKRQLGPAFGQSKVATGGQTK